MKNTLILLLTALTLSGNAQTKDPDMGIIPAPVSVQKGKGEFKFSPETIVFVDSPDHKAMRFFAAYLRKAGLAGTVTDLGRVDKRNVAPKNIVVLSLNFKGELPPEGYELKVTDDKVVLNARGAGMFYGIQTLIQLLEMKSPGYANIPCVTIKDNPRFPYRGMHLDVARHFFDVDFVKKYIDVMAMYKLNYFHWHLTDDQGWRIEIKKYPKLTEVGSKRAQTRVGRASGPTSVPDLYDNMPYGGFYTQEQIADVVDYANARYITIVPEIEMPGHAMAAIASYPELSCDPSKTYKVGETWGQYDDEFCPTDETFKMLYDILKEVMDMFPGKYIHIGGDECSKVSWKKSEFCRQLIADNRLKNEEGLQSYFIGKIEKFVNSQGRQIIGWDEILEGGLAPNATVMSWRGDGGGIAAAQLGHDVIMTPGSGGLYFDHAQSKSTQEPLNIGGNAPLSKTYSYDPIPAALNGEQKKHVIGVQANMWTEYMATSSKVEYMLLPRMLALSEVAWSPEKQKDYKNFSEIRVAKQLLRLDGEGYNYRVPVAIGAGDTTMKGDKFTIDLKPPIEGAKIFYTLDGNDARETDLPFTSPMDFTIPENKTVQFKSIVVTASGKRSISTCIKMENTK
jgi:hexosaminidase